MANEKLEELKKKFNTEDKPTFAAAIWICIMLFVFLVILSGIVINKRRIIKSSAERASTLTGNFFSDLVNPVMSKYDLLTDNDMKQFLKGMAFIAVYVLCIFYSIKKLDVIKVSLLIPLILITTLPLVLRYGFDLKYAPIADPLLSFLLVIVTGNLWYTFTSIDETISNEDTKAFNINISIIFVFSYVLFKYYYNNDNTDTLFRTFMLTGACGIFMVSAPMYAYTPKLHP